jgi:hypothetical protein
MLTLGFVSAILPDLPIEDVLSFATEADFDCIELMCWPKGKAERRYAGVTHIDVLSLDPEGAEEIKEQFNRRALRSADWAITLTRCSRRRRGQGLYGSHPQGDRSGRAARCARGELVYRARLDCPWTITGRASSRPGSRSSPLLKSAASTSASRTVPCCSRATNGRAARI